MRPAGLLAAAAGLSICTGTALGAIAPNAVAAAAKRPDIVVIMVDDLGYIPNDRVLRLLPHIRETFLDGGMRFREMHNETPLCSPSRASFLTGQHAQHHGVVKNDGDLLDSDQTIVTELQASGYYTLMVGDYLNAYDGTRTPPGWDHIAMQAGGTETTFWIDGSATAFGDRFKTDVTRETAVQWLKDAPKDQPLFAWLSLSAPHGCRQDRYPKLDCHEPLVMQEDWGAPECRGTHPFKPPTYTTRTTSLRVPGEMPAWPNGWKLGKVCRSLLVVDRLVGQAVAAQQARGRPAYFVFLSDNGMSWGQRGVPGKNVPLATRIPFYVAGPGISHGSKTNALHSDIDIAPTLADIAGTSLSFADGKSFLPLLHGEASSGRARILQARHTRRYGWQAIRTKDWRFIRWEDGRKRLYHVSSDPWERHNLLRKRPAVVRLLKWQLNRMLMRAAE